MESRFCAEYQIMMDKARDSMEMTSIAIKQRFLDSYKVIKKFDDYFGTWKEYCFDKYIKTKEVDRYWRFMLPLDPFMAEIVIINDYYKPLTSKEINERAREIFIQEATKFCKTIGAYEELKDTFL